MSSQLSNGTEIRISRIKAIQKARPLRNSLARVVQKVPQHRKPDDMSLEEWQIAIRQEFSRDQGFKIRNIGEGEVYSEYSVINPVTGGDYLVAIRGELIGDNHCTCPDYSINTLGTCKHIERVLSRIRKKSRKALKTSFYPQVSEIFLRYGGIREVVFRPAKIFPEMLKGMVAKYFDSTGILLPDRHSHFGEFLREMREADQEVRCFDDVHAFLAQEKDREDLRRRIDKFFPKGIDSPAFDKLIMTTLYPYQKEGALFAAKAGRVLIADDMGLGKTIQAIAASEILGVLGFVERVLVVSPTSLKHQWKIEIEKFSQRSVSIVEGLSETRAKTYELNTFFKITNYDVIHRDLELIKHWDPDLIILDEAQRIKNWKTRTARSVKKLASPHAFVLTGTPLENRIEELHSIVEFVDRFHLGPMFRFLDQHQIVDSHGKVTGYQNLSKVKETLSPILVRRRKQEVLTELPERLEKKFFVPMTEEQSKHHEENRDIVARIVNKWRRFKFLSESDSLLLRIALQRMRMSCNSTYLIDKKTDFGVKADELMSVLSDIFEEKDSKIVLFSQWVGTHEIIIRRLNARKLGYVFFHGGVPGKERGKLIARFKEDPNCKIFLSTDAGGVGLNLQNASAVINMDQPWNPAVLEQRIGRVHRLGQHKPVRVIHFISQGTIEQGMLGLLSFKKSMFAGVLDNGEDTVHLGQSKMNKFMETIEKATVSIPEQMPRQMALPSEILAPPKPVEAGLGKDNSSTNEAWSEVLTSGLSFLKTLGNALSSRGEKRSLFKVNEDGKSYLQIPLPEKDQLEEITKLFSELFKTRL